jgi:hypothetical protein
MPSPASARGEQRTLKNGQLQRIRRRHQGFRILLITISLLLLLQPIALRWPWLNPLGANSLSLVMMLFLTRFSPVRSHSKLFYGSASPPSPASCAG